MERLTENTHMLMVDDNPIDRSLYARALKESGVASEVSFFENGEKLIEYLKGSEKLLMQRQYDFHPFLILLDLNMPIMNGRETLKIIKNDPHLKRIPIVVLTGSTLDDDINGSYQDGANTVFTKPFSFGEMVALMDSVKSYWLQKAQLPFSWR